MTEGGVFSFGSGDSGDKLDLGTAELVADLILQDAEDMVNRMMRIRAFLNENVHFLEMMGAKSEQARFENAASAAEALSRMIDSLVIGAVAFERVLKTLHGSEGAPDGV